MTTNLTLSLAEIGLFLGAAVIMGITLRHFAAGRKRSRKTEQDNTDDIAQPEIQTESIPDPEVTALQHQLKLSSEKINLLTIESEELRWRYRSFEVLKEELEKKVASLPEKDNLRHIIIKEKTLLTANG